MRKLPQSMTSTTLPICVLRDGPKPACLPQGGDTDGILKLDGRRTKGFDPSAMDDALARESPTQNVTQMTQPRRRNK